MSRLFLALLIFPLLAGAAFGQTAAPQAPIICDAKDNIEDDACKAKLTGMFVRNGDTLTLSLDGGKSKKYTGNLAACDGETTDAEKCLTFRLARYFPHIQSYLVEVGLYEGGRYLLIGKRSGIETTISTDPVLSPNGRYVISIDQNEAGDREYDIAIWSVQADPPKLEFKYKGKDNEYWEIKSWKDETRISMKAWVAVQNSYDQEAELMRKGKGWTLVLGKKTPRAQ